MIRRIRTRLIPILAAWAVLLAAGAVFGCTAASQPESEPVESGRTKQLESAPVPSVTGTAKSTPAVTATAPVAADDLPTPSPTRSVTPVAQITAEPADGLSTERSDSKPVNANGFVGIAFDVAPDVARERALSGNFGPPAEFAAGQRIYAAYLFRESKSSFEIRRVWETANGLVVGGGDDIIVAGAEFLGSANIGARWGIPGGVYVLKLSRGGNVLGSESFVVDVETPIFTRLAFATELDEHRLALEPGHDFPSGTRRVFASFQVFNAPHDLILTANWIVNGKLVEERRITWEADFDRGPGSFQTVSIESPGTTNELSAGDHRLAIIWDGREVLNDVFKMG